MERQNRRRPKPKGQKPKAPKSKAVRPKRRRPAEPKGHLPQHIEFAILEKFLELQGEEDPEKRKIGSMVKWIEAQPWFDPAIHRSSAQAIYRYVRRALRKGYLRHCPPRNEGLWSEFDTRFGLSGEVEIIDVLPETASRHLAPAAARLVLKLVREVYKTKRQAYERAKAAFESGESAEDPGDPPRVHLGFGAGGTARRVAQALASELRCETSVPPITIHALTSGFDVHQTLDAPVAFFSYFEDVTPRVKTVGLYSAPVVNCAHYQDTLQEHGVKEAMAAVREVDIVVTSLARGADEHGLLTRFLRLYQDAQTTWRRQGHVGDVLMQPYSDEGPLPLTHGIRAVTLFNLKELVELAATEGKHVVLVAGPCGACKHHKAEALHPLLTIDSLKVCNHLVTDATTAEAVLEFPDHRRGR